MLSVWAPCAAWLVCFASLGSPFPVVCMRVFLFVFLFWDRRRVCVCSEPEAPSSPPGELLHSHRTATSLAVFSPFPSPSLRLHHCDGPCLSEQHTHLGAATCRRKLKRALSRILSAGAFEEELAGVGVDLHHSQLDVFLLPLGGNRMCDPEKTIGDLGSASWQRQGVALRV